MGDSGRESSDYATNDIFVVTVGVIDIGVHFNNLMGGCLPLAVNPPPPLICQSM